MYVTPNKEKRIPCSDSVFRFRDCLIYYRALNDNAARFGTLDVYWMVSWKTQGSISVTNDSTARFDKGIDKGKGQGSYHQYISFLSVAFI